MRRGFFASCGAFYFSGIFPLARRNKLSRLSVRLDGFSVPGAGPAQ